MDKLVNSIVEQQNFLIPFLAFLGGILASTLPCSLASIPLVITYVGGANADEPKTAFKLSLLFALGTATTFTILGIMAATVGTFFGSVNKWFNLFLGVLMIVMSLQVMGVFEFIPSANLLSRNKRRGMLGAYITGILGGLFSSPCATPIIIALLGIVARGGSLIWGGLLFFMYSLGHSVLVLVAGTSFGFVEKISKNQKYTKLTKVLQIILGLLFLALGIYLLYLEM